MKRIVVSFDGTWKTADSGPNPTNVVKIRRAIPEKDSSNVYQCTVYDEGVGTGGIISQFFGGITGAGLTANILDGYKAISDRYQEGDEIYMFGFSRGAYTARSLAGLIELAGIFKTASWGKEDWDKLLKIWREDPSKAQRMGTASRQERIKNLAFARHKAVSIKCLGVWDTVGSLGIPAEFWREFLERVRPRRFRNAELASNVEVALHAIAIDEKRAAFPPTIWTLAKKGTLPDNQIVEQRWFPGVHANIGGGGGRHRPVGYHAGMDDQTSQ